VLQQEEIEVSEENILSLLESNWQQSSHVWLRWNSNQTIACCSNRTQAPEVKSMHALTMQCGTSRLFLHFYLTVLFCILLKSIVLFSQDIFEQVSKAYDFLCSRSSRKVLGPDPRNIILILRAQSILFSRCKEGLGNVYLFKIGCNKYGQERNIIIWDLRLLKILNIYPYTCTQHWQHLTYYIFKNFRLMLNNWTL
jgi:hypothetical protein